MLSHIHRQNEATQNITISLEGKGHQLLWTKNALERSGYTTRVIDRVDLKEAIHITIETEETKPRWILNKNNQQYSVHSIATLIEHL